MANSIQETVELRLRTMRMLWFALFATVGVYFLFTLYVGRSEDREPNPTLSLILIVIGVSTTLLSFVIKSKLINLGIERQRVQLVQQAYLVAWAMTELAALLGMLDFFATGHQHYYILFIITAVGMLLQTPRREHVINAWPKTQL